MPKTNYARDPPFWKSIKNLRERTVVTRSMTRLNKDEILAVIFKPLARKSYHTEDEEVDTKPKLNRIDQRRHSVGVIVINDDDDEEDVKYVPANMQHRRYTSASPINLRIWDGDSDGEDQNTSIVEQKEKCETNSAITAEKQEENNQEIIIISDDDLTQDVPDQNNFISLQIKDTVEGREERHKTLDEVPNINGISVTNQTYKEKSTHNSCEDNNNTTTISLYVSMEEHITTQEKESDQLETKKIEYHKKDNNNSKSETTQSCCNLRAFRKDKHDIKEKKQIVDNKTASSVQNRAKSADRTTHSIDKNHNKIMSVSNSENSNFFKGDKPSPKIDENRKMHSHEKQTQKCRKSKLNEESEERNICKKYKNDQKPTKVYDKDVTKKQDKTDRPIRKSETSTKHDDKRPKRSTESERDKKKHSEKSSDKRGIEGCSKRRSASDERFSDHKSPSKKSKSEHEHKKTEHTEKRHSNHSTKNQPNEKRRHSSNTTDESEKAIKDSRHNRIESAPSKKRLVLDDDYLGRIMDQSRLSKCSKKSAQVKSCNSKSREENEKKLPKKYAEQEQEPERIEKNIDLDDKSRHAKHSKRSEDVKTRSLGSSEEKKSTQDRDKLSKKYTEKDESSKKTYNDRYASTSKASSLTKKSNGAEKKDQNRMKIKTASDATETKQISKPSRSQPNTDLQVRKSTTLSDKYMEKSKESYSTKEKNSSKSHNRREIQANSSDRKRPSDRLDLAENNKQDSTAPKKEGNTCNRIVKRRTTVSFPITPRYMTRSASKLISAIDLDQDGLERNESTSKISATRDHNKNKQTETKRNCKGSPNTAVVAVNDENEKRHIKKILTRRYSTEMLLDDNRSSKPIGSKKSEARDREKDTSTRDGVSDYPANVSGFLPYMARDPRKIAQRRYSVGAMMGLCRDSDTTDERSLRAPESDDPVEKRLREMFPEQDVEVRNELLSILDSPRYQRSPHLLEEQHGNGHDQKDDVYVDEDNKDSNASEFVEGTEEAGVIPSNMMTHYKKRLIHQLEKPTEQAASEDDSSKSPCRSPSEIVKSPSMSPTDQCGKKKENVQLRIARKRTNCRSQYRHQSFELFKLGSGNPTSLCKSKEPYKHPEKTTLKCREDGSKESVDQSKESITEYIINKMEGNKKRESLLQRSTSIGSEKSPNNAIHSLPAIISDVPETTRRKVVRGTKSSADDKTEVSPLPKTVNGSSESLELPKEESIHSSHATEVVIQRQNVINEAQNPSETNVSCGESTMPQPQIMPMNLSMRKDGDKRLDYAPTARKSKEIIGSKPDNAENVDDIMAKSVVGFATTAMPTMKFNRDSMTVYNSVYRQLKVYILKLTISSEVMLALKRTMEDVVRLVCNEVFGQTTPQLLVCIDQLLSLDLTPHLDLLKSLLLNFPKNVDTGNQIHTINNILNTIRQNPETKDIPTNEILLSKYLVEPVSNKATVKTRSVPRYKEATIRPAVFSRQGTFNQTALGGNKMSQTKTDRLASRAQRGSPRLQNLEPRANTNYSGLPLLPSTPGQHILSNEAMYRVPPTLHRMDYVAQHSYSLPSGVLEHQTFPDRLRPNDRSGNIQGRYPTESYGIYSAPYNANQSYRTRSNIIYPAANNFDFDSYRVPQYNDYSNASLSAKSGKSSNHPKPPETSAANNKTRTQATELLSDFGSTQITKVFPTPSNRCHAAFGKYPPHPNGHVQNIGKYIENISLNEQSRERLRNLSDDNQNVFAAQELHRHNNDYGGAVVIKDSSIEITRERTETARKVQSDAALTGNNDVIVERVRNGEEDAMNSTKDIFDILQSTKWRNLPEEVKKTLKAKVQSLFEDEQGVEDEEVITIDDDEEPTHKSPQLIRAPTISPKRKNDDTKNAVPKKIRSEEVSSACDKSNNVNQEQQISDKKIQGRPTIQYEDISSEEDFPLPPNGCPKRIQEQPVGGECHKKQYTKPTHQSMQYDSISSEEEFAQHLKNNLKTMKESPISKEFHKKLYLKPTNVSSMLKQQLTVDSITSQRKTRHTPPTNVRMPNEPTPVDPAVLHMATTGHRSGISRINDEFYPIRKNNSPPQLTSPTTSHWQLWLSDENFRNMYNNPNSRRHSVETISNAGSDYSPTPSDDNTITIKIDSKWYRIKRPLYEKIPKGKLCYIRDRHAFIRYFDDSQMKQFINNMNDKDDPQVESDLMKQMKCRNNGFSNSDMYIGPIDPSMRNEFISMPQNVMFSSDDNITDPKLYVAEIMTVEKYIPGDFYSYYKYVTGYQIAHCNRPISFQTFLTMHNTNGMKELLKKYVNSLIEGKDTTTFSNS